MADLMNLDRLDEKVREIVRPYCEKFIELHGYNLKGLAIYGSATSDEFIPGKSNINIFAAFERIDPPDLKKSLNLVASGRKKGITAPLMLTLKHIRRSTDAFPIEFLEIKENYILLYGEDVLKDLEIRFGNIRLQCEQKIKGGLIRLYQSYLEVGRKIRELKALLVDSIKSLMPAFRSLLRLKGKEPPVRKRDIAKALCKEFGLQEKVFTDVLDIREARISNKDIERIFNEYIKEIEKLGIETDRMEI